MFNNKMEQVIEDKMWLMSSIPEPRYMPSGAFMFGRQ